MRGRLFVIDGPDGTGKQTQTSMLVEHLRTEGYTVGTLDFPRYGEWNPFTVRVDRAVVLFTFYENRRSLAAAEALVGRVLDRA